MDVVLSVPGAAVNRAKAGAGQFLTDSLVLLGRVSHRAADEIISVSGGPLARPLTEREQRLVKEAYGDRVSASLVRVVPGCGYSTIAFTAFLNGNPAITLGNTIFVKPDLAWFRPDNLPQTVGGLKLLLHEYTHVVQYATWGFSGFGARYAAELKRYGNAERLYDYRSRHLPFEAETLEGQAQIVGDLAGARRGLTPDDVTLRSRLGAKLLGTRIYGN